MIFGIEQQRAFKLALLCGAAFSLQGCIAAAFPLAAGGLMASGAETERGELTDIAAAPEPAVETAPIAAPPALVAEAEAAAPPVDTLPGAPGQGTPNLVEELIPAGPNETAPPRQPVDVAAAEENAAELASTSTAPAGFIGPVDEPEQAASAATERSSSIVRVDPTSPAEEPVQTPPSAAPDRATEFVEAEAAEAPISVPVPPSTVVEREVALVEAHPSEYIEKGRFDVEKGDYPTWAHPVVANGKFYLRDMNKLTCYAVKE